MLNISRLNALYIIAEIGSNHNGDLNLARKLIKEAKECGANAVKLQFFNKENLFTSDLLKQMDEGVAEIENIDAKSVSDQIEEYTLDESELRILRDYCREINIDFGCTAADKNGLQYLDKIDADFIKIASCDINNYDLIETAIKTGRSMIVSTGMADMSEIDKVYRLFNHFECKKFALLHCVSLYPPKDEYINLNFMQTLKHVYDCEIGYSDHALGFAIPLGAIAMGAKIIEKHFTIDKTMEGWDHQISADRNDMAIICKQGARIFKALGKRYKYLASEEIEKRDVFRKSITTSKQIEKNKIIEYDDIVFKRPGDGISIADIEHVVGRRARRSIKSDKTIQKKDLI